MFVGHGAVAGFAGNKDDFCFFAFGHRGCDAEGEDGEAEDEEG